MCWCSFSGRVYTVHVDIPVCMSAERLVPIMCVSAERLVPIMCVSAERLVPIMCVSAERLVGVCLLRDWCL